MCFNILPVDSEGIISSSSLKSGMFQNKSAEQVGFAQGELRSLLLPGEVDKMLRRSMSLKMKGRQEKAVSNDRS